MFDETFRVCFADTPFGVALHQRIRYRVFCLDKGFEDPCAFSSARETDAWDDQSAHFIVQDKTTRQWVAATRMVLPKGGRPLPVDNLGAFDRDGFGQVDRPVAEISRFCIVRNRPQRSIGTEGLSEANSLQLWGIGAIGKSRQFEITLGMMRAQIIFALKRGIDACVMLITDPFARLLRRLGLRFTQVGPPVQHRGTRTAYLVDMRESALSMSQESSVVRGMLRRSKHAYVRISSVAGKDLVDTVSEFSPDHSLFNETMFRETVLLPAEDDLDLCAGVGD
jgi:N-acyl amino acid synthase of PEP-CTERM/exosortase system